MVKYLFFDIEKDRLDGTKKKFDVLTLWMGVLSWWVVEEMKYQYLVVVGIFLIILYGSLFLWLFNEWMNNPYYSHGLLIPFICFFLLFLKKDNIKKSLSPKETVRSTSEKNSFFADDQTKALLFLSAGIFLYFIGFFQAFAFLMMCSFLLVIMGIILYFSNTVLLSLVWFPIIYFIFAIPLPFVFLS